MIASLIVFPLLVLYLACLGWWVGRSPVRNRPWRAVVQVGFFLGLSRLGILWFLLVLYWLNQLHYWHLILMVLLLPEALLLPRNLEWTLGMAFLANGLILVGSVTMAGLLVLGYRRWGKPRDRHPFP